MQAIVIGVIVVLAFAGIIGLLTRKNGQNVLVGDQIAGAIKKGSITAEDIANTITRCV